MGEDKESWPGCPLTQHGPCHKEFCAWWIKGENKPGGCCIPRLTHYLAALLKDTSRLADATSEIPKVLDALDSLFENRRR